MTGVGESLSFSTNNSGGVNTNHLDDDNNEYDGGDDGFDSFYNPISIVARPEIIIEYREMYKKNALFGKTHLITHISHRVG